MTPSPSRVLITTGPECSGKTTLATALSSLLACPLITEVARDYLTAHQLVEPGRRYTQDDLFEIARLQHAREVLALQSEPATLVCDTDLLVIMVWSEVVFGNCAPPLQRLFEQSLHNGARRYLLCDYAIAWQPDPLRENPHDRDMLFVRYRDKLERLGLEYVIITGTEEQRLQLAQQYLHAQARSFA